MECIFENAIIELKTMMIKKKISRTEIAKSIGVTNNTMTNILNKKIGSVYTMKLIFDFVQNYDIKKEN